MGIQRADILYPVNTTTVDTAAGIDIRLLDSAQAGATDTSQSCRWLHTNDGVERTFDPASALVTAVANANSFQGEGWALRLSDDMTPTDDTNCNSALLAGTLVVSVRALLNMNAGTGNLGGAENFTMRASLWRYDTSANTGVLIASGSAAQSWDTSALGGENNTIKDTAISIVVPSTVEFLANEVLLLQLGALSGTLTNPLTGTTNFDMTLHVDDANTNINFAASQGIRQVCVFTTNLAGKGTAFENAKAITMSDDLVGDGVLAYEKSANINKSFDLAGKGEVTDTKDVKLNDLNLTGKGTPTMSRVVAASKTFNLVGKGTAFESGKAIAIAKSLVGKGTVTLVKQSLINKVFNLVGKGTLTETHPVQAFRTFNLIGKGTLIASGLNASTIEIPIDEVPTGGGGTTIIIKKNIIVLDD